MNRRQRFNRKIVYAGVIAALLLPLSWLSQPQTTETDGGRLAQLRKDNHLSQAQLGEIDPASETIKLATLGMRGVAANLLWTKANEYRKTEDWVNMSATLEQISRLQPNFVSVWIFQGWNLSYNISVEFDDYHDRYYWVIKGINFLKEGTQYNRDEPRLLSKIGYTIGNKIGRADEKELYRQLFKEDDDFHGDRPKAQRDNWLVGREWMLKAQDAVARGVPLRGEAPLLFYVHPVMCQIDYAEALEEEGTFGEVAKSAWAKAADAWTEFSNRDLPGRANVFMRLSEKEAYDEKSRQAQEELAKLTPEGVRETLLAEKVATLPKELREVYDTPADSRTPDQQRMVPVIEQSLELAHLEIAERVKPADHAAALRAAEEATFADEMSKAIDVDRGIVNYNYWTLRCQVEPTDEALAARKLIYDADQMFTSAKLEESRDLYVEGFQKWRQVLDAYPGLMDASITDELVDSINHYRSVLGQLEEQFPQPFVLQNVLNAHNVFRGSGMPLEDAENGEADSQANDPGNPTP